MQVGISSERMKVHGIATSANIVRSCVHCGFCLATCPTYLLLGDELDSPRGRIYQIKEMLETGGAPSAETVKHVDRCLSCLACTTTCPSSVDYMHLVDHARAYIEDHHRRPPAERVLRTFLAFALTKRAVFRVLLRLAALFRPLTRGLPGRMGAMAAMAPRVLPRRDPAETPQTFGASGRSRGRVALLTGCAQPVLAPQVNAAAIRHLNRLGVDVLVAPGSGCCGALPHHLGRAGESHRLARANIEAWSKAAGEGELDAIIITASGCGTTVKDYGFLFADDAQWAGRAARVSGLARDITEYLLALPEQPPSAAPGPLTVAYQSACSLQHGQKVTRAPIDLLRAAGYHVVEPREQHICCGSAGTYSILQPDLAGRLRSRKVSALEATGADVIATGNIGCMTHISAATALPVVHTVELLDWAAGGPEPAVLASTAKPGGRGP